jgi:hypothetical protein
LAQAGKALLIAHRERAIAQTEFEIGQTRDLLDRVNGFKQAIYVYSIDLCANSHFLHCFLSC